MYARRSHELQVEAWLRQSELLKRLIGSMASPEKIRKVDLTKEKPLNREPSTKALVDQFLTPQETSYDRNHGLIPTIAGESHSIRIDGLVNTPLSLTTAQLRSEFPQHEVTCALECAGNRRHTMRTLLKEVQGIDWGDAAIMNCKWKGPRLRDVILRAGVRGDSDGSSGQQLHVAFACYKAKCQDDDWFEASVPLEMCLRVEREAILALEVNDTPLTKNHGYPVRVVLPGIVGVRWVKWLDRIIVQDHESPNIYQQQDYKVLPPEAVDSESAKQYWGRTPPMYDIPINSAIALPADGETVTLSSTGTVQVKGYAIPQGANGPVTRVEVSGDSGESWVDADLDGSHQSMKWCWVLWTADVKLAAGRQREIWSRATDAGGNSQEREHSQWNLRGVGYSGYGRARDLIVV